MSALAVATMVRNPRIQDLAEWVAYYLVRGVSRILIYDHGRLDGHSYGIADLYEPLAPWRDEGVVEVHTRISEEACQLNGYADEGRVSTPDVFWTQAMLVDARLRLQDAFRWVAFLDHDEFLCTRSRSQLADVLDAQSGPNTAVLQVEMRRFGNSGHYLRPRGLVLENYTWRERDFPLDLVRDVRRHTPLKAHGNWTKCVLRPQRVVRPDYGNHTWLTAHGFCSQPLAADVVQLNHYFTKSVEDWIDTAMLGSAQGHPPHRNWDVFDSLATAAGSNSTLIGNRSVVEDRHIQHYVPAVREELARIGLNVERASPAHQEN